MIIDLAQGHRRRSRQSMAAGAASLSDSSMCSPVVLVLLVLGRRAGRVVVASTSPSAPSRRERLDGPLVPGHEVAQDLLGDQEAVLQLGDRLGRGLEEDDVVRALAVAVDGIRQAPTAPRARP